MERSTFINTVEKHIESDPDHTSLKYYNRMLEENAKDNPYSVWTPEYRQLLADRAMWNLENDRLVMIWDSIKMVKHMESNPDRASMQKYNQMLEECAKDNPYSFWTTEYRLLLEDHATWKIENDFFLNVNSCN